MTGRVVLIAAIVAVSLVAPASADGRKGSHRVGGYGPQGRGSHYVGGHRPGLAHRLPRKL